MRCNLLQICVVLIYLSFILGISSNALIIEHTLFSSEQIYQCDCTNRLRKCHVRACTISLLHDFRTQLIFLGERGLVGRREEHARFHEIVKVMYFDMPHWKISLP